MTSHTVEQTASQFKATSEAAVIVKEVLKENKAVSAKDVEKAEAVKGGKSQLIALILCILVGILGVHRFYMGYIWQGVVQLLTFGGFGIWTLIDLVRIITGDLTPASGNWDETL